jgi:hypothetical protein
MQAIAAPAMNRIEWLTILLLLPPVGLQEQ